MFAHRKYTLVVADAYNDDSDAASSPFMTPCPSPAPPPSVHSPAPLLFNRRRLPRPPPPANGDTTGLPPVLFSSLSASILQDRRQATPEAATGAAAVAGPLSSSSVLVSAAANNERAALERTFRQRISGRQRHPAGRSGVADREPAPLMEPLIVDPAAVLDEEDRFLVAAVPGGGNCGEKAAVPGGGNGGEETEAVVAHPLRPWCQVRGGERRLGQRLDVMSRAAERRPKAVDGGSPLVQGLKDFFSKMFAGR
jgi:hypothetical protein